MNSHACRNTHHQSRQAHQQRQRTRTRRAEQRSAAQRRRASSCPLVSSPPHSSAAAVSWHGVSCRAVSVSPNTDAPGLCSYLVALLERESSDEGAPLSPCGPDRAEYLQTQLHEFLDDGQQKSRAAK